MAWALAAALTLALVGLLASAAPARNGPARLVLPSCTSGVFPARAARQQAACDALRDALAARIQAAGRPTGKLLAPALGSGSLRATGVGRLSLARRAKVNPLRVPGFARWKTGPAATTRAAPRSPRDGRGVRLLADSASTGLRSDEFDGAAIDTSLWTFVDPVGDVGLTATGTHAEISVPAGVRHDLWTGADEVPRLLQAAPDVDFEVEAKWDSAVGAAYQLQGFLVVQDADDMLRIETHSDGGGTRLFVARIAGGSASTVHYSTVPGGAPVYFRLARDGNSWTLRLSSNGTSWTTAASFTQALSVSALGPFAGNSGANPAFTSRIDHFRVVSQTLPDPAPPAISSVSAAPSGVGATISWSTDEPASSAVAWGLDATYGGGLVGEPALVTSHSVSLAGLACGTVYHFQVRSRDAAGNEAASPDGTFQTQPCGGSIRSDEFDGASLDTSLWTLVDPVGDAGLALTGSHAELSVPAGVRHDLWTNADEIPRLVQAAPNTDFEVEVKWDSAVSAAYQQQGILVVQDADDMLRIETHSDGGGTRLFVARIAGGSASTVHYSTVAGGAPVYFRLKRAGSTWTLSHSADGATWTVGATFTQALNVTAIGPFAGNSGSNPPAYTSRIDYFRDIPPDVTPPSISGVAVAATGATATISWTTNESATSTVAYGPDATYASGTVTRQGTATSHQVAVHGLACATTYHFQVRSTDLAGNAASSPDATFATSPCPEFIQSDEFDGPTLDTDVWSFVDPVGDSTLSFESGRAVISVPAGVRHDLWTGANEAPRLLQAAPDTGFEVEAKFDEAVGLTYQTQGIVVEQDADDLLRLEVHAEGQQTKLFVARLTNGVASVIESRTIPGGAPLYLRVKRAGTSWTFSYSSDGQTWAVGAAFANALSVSAVGPYAGNTGGSPPAFASRIDYFREVTDRTPPAITELLVSPRATSAVVTWTTDEPASSLVAHGPTTAYGGTAGDVKLVTRHWARVTGLTCGTTYHLQVRSTDDLGNQASSSDHGFSTTSCSGAAAPDIDVWGGSTQVFGSVGIPQRWVNVVGNVYDPQGVASLRASLNGGPAQNLTVGPDGNRLEHAGDFNVELNRDLLLPGDNAVVITAVDGAGNQAVRTVTVQWQGNSAGGLPPANGPALVIMAHSDDEALGAAAVIQLLRNAGRQVYVAIVTNGDSDGLAGQTACGAVGAQENAVAAYGITRNAETLEAMALLGLTYSPNPSQSDIFFLGYPGNHVQTVAEASTPWQNDPTGLHRTYAEDGDGSSATCDGDLRHGLSGQHAQLTAAALAADVDAVLALVDPSDVYTHVEFDGNRDHAEVARQIVAAVKRAGQPVRVHGTLMHPHGTDACQPLSAAQWPNPALVGDDHLARFTPGLDVAAPPVPTCSQQPTGSDWGPLGPPNEWVEVPASMQANDEATNLKWQVISKYATQIDCNPNSPAYVTCGYMRAFVKKHEFFWTRTYGSPRVWPLPYTADWTSTASIAERAQVVEGQWAYDAVRDGARAVRTGFDRMLNLGQVSWTSYEVTVPITYHWFDQTKPQAGAGVALGWQGHTGTEQPRIGHPYGALCSFGRAQPDPAPTRLEIGQNRGFVEDTIMAFEDPPRSIVLGAEYRLKFRRVGLGNGLTRYSCKLWKSGTAEPGSWDLTVDLADWPGETGPHPGSVLLFAHQTDVTFGDVTVTPVAGS